MPGGSRGSKKYKSFQFKNGLVWKRDRRGRTSAPGKPEMEIGSPVELKGEPGLWSPEELLVGALNGCLMLTFVALAQNKGVQFLAYESAAEGLLENVDGKYRITEVSVQPKLVLKSATDLDTARTIMDAVEENCFIPIPLAPRSNWLRSRVRYRRIEEYTPTWLSWPVRF